MAAAGPALGRRQLGVAGCSPAAPRPRARICAADLRRGGRGQVLVGEPQQFGRARARRAGRDLLDVGAEHGRAASERRRHSGRRAAAHSRSRLRSCSACAICSRADLLAPGEVGDRPRQPQHPVVGAAAEPLARVELGEQRRGVLVESALARLGRRHLGVAAPGPSRRSWRSRAATTRSRTAAEGSPGAPPISSALGLADRGEDVDPVGERAAQPCPGSAGRRAARSCTPGRPRRARRDRGWRRRPA